MKKLQQFKIYSFTFDKINACNFKINTTPFESELKGEVVALGDNECLRAIRRITKHSFSELELNELLQEKSFLVKQKNSLENKEKIKNINNKIRDMLFIPQFVSVSTKGSKSYLKIGEKGFYINGVHYIRFMCGAGHARTNRAMFIDERIFEELVSILRNGCKDTPIVGAKYNAYFSLSSSATYIVSTPRFCVVPDKEIKMIKKVDWFEDGEEKDVLTPNCDKELNFNLWDGMGIISPSFANKWAEELEIDYLPSEFVCRAPFTKGLVCVFDFVDFAEKVAKNYMIKDIYGKEWDCRELDIILTESQFKYSSAFDSIDSFASNMVERDLHWGVSKISPKNEDSVKMSNYQFLQVLNCKDDDIKKLCEQTVDWLSGISYKDYPFMLLYLLGKLIKKNEYYDVFNKIGDSFVKALLLCPELMQDSYIIDRINRSTEKRKKEACMGKLILDGNFQFLVMDPYALCEHIFGLEVKGLLNEFEHYSKYWLDKNKKDICALRSPMTWRSEVNLLHIKDNEDIEYWYKYLKSGIVLNVWGYDNMLFSGADADGDNLFTTDNEAYLKCRYGGIPTAYSPKKAAKVNIDINKLYNFDVLGFNTKIGFITNCSTTLYEMQTQYEPNSKEYKEIEYRLKLCCKYQSHEIDHAKGIQTKVFPKHFTNYQKIDDDDSQEVKNEKTFNNKLVVDKRPYFMRHRYSEYNIQYKNHVADFDRYCMTMYGYKYHELPEDFKSTNEYAELKKYYDYRCPLLETNGTMNRICYYMENALKNIKSSTKKLKNEDLYDILHNYTQIDQYKLAQIENIYNEYVNFKHSKMLQDSEFSTYEQFYKYLRNKSLEEISNNIEELAEISLYLCYKMNKKKEFAWDVFGNGIVQCIMNKKISKNDTFIQIPQLSEFGDIEYLGEKYTMMSYDFAKNNENFDVEIENFDKNQEFLDDFDDLLADLE